MLIGILVSLAKLIIYKIRCENDSLRVLQINAFITSALLDKHTGNYLKRLF